MIDWELIDREEEAALVAYARLLGMTPDEFAKAKLVGIRIAEDNFNRAQTNIGGKERLACISH